MSNDQVVADAAERVAAADKEAATAHAAFITGKFPEYWQRKAEEAAKRIEEMYGNGNTATGNS